MKLTLHSHRDGFAQVPAELQGSVRTALEQLKHPVGKGCTVHLREAILVELTKTGWSGRTKVDVESDINILSISKGIAFQLQTGNMSRFYADLMKLQLIYLKDRIKGAIYMLPTKEAADKINSNIVNYTRFVEELKIFDKIVTVPMIVMGFEEDC